MNEYFIGLMVVAMPLVLLSRGALARCSAVIILNWVLGYAFNEAFSTFTPWAWSTILDTISAIIVLWHPAGRWQALIGVTYALQLICHYAFALARWHPHDYWFVLTAIAWVQLMILGAWGCGRIFSHIKLRSDNPKTRASHNKGLDG